MFDQPFLMKPTTDRFGFPHVPVVFIPDDDAEEFHADFIVAGWEGHLDRRSFNINNGERLVATIVPTENQDIDALRKWICDRNK
jgi:hypothetical protein